MAEKEGEKFTNTCQIPGCNQTFKYKSQLELHCKLVHVFPYYNGQYCSSLFKDHRIKEKHEENDHGPETRDPRTHNSTNTAWGHS